MPDQTHDRSPDGGRPDPPLRTPPDRWKEAADRCRTTARAKLDPSPHRVGSPRRDHP